ncbi:hypothetical protein AB0I81_06705 [Nonomuraea sp. NPDC050404]|uniref:hypothetical protein n=1 Tax=Nonomuraea sp. NPDC050404 TaxID=3155783 RepID=UPI0033C86568
MEVESSICLSDLVPALRWSRPQQVAEALGDPRLPAGWWSSLALSKALGTAGLDWICDRLARLASARWDHLPLGDLLPALAVHHIDPSLPGWPEATRTAIAGLGGWQRLRRLSPSDLGTPSASPEVVIGSVFREILGRIPVQRELSAAVKAGHPEVTRPLPRGQSPQSAFNSPSGAFPVQGEAAAQASPTGPLAGRQAAGVPQRQTGSFPAVQPPSERQTGSFPAVAGEPGSRQTGSFPAVADNVSGPPQTGSFPAVPPSERQTGSFPGQNGPRPGAQPGQAGPQPTPGQGGPQSAPGQGAGNPAQPQNGSLPAQPQSGSSLAQPQTGSFQAQPQTGSFQAQPPGGEGPRQGFAGEGGLPQRPATPGQSERLPQRPAGPQSGRQDPAAAQSSPGAVSSAPSAPGAAPAAPGAGPAGPGSTPSVPGATPSRPGSAATRPGGPHTGSIPPIPGGPHTGSIPPVPGGPHTGSMPPVPGGSASGGPHTGSIPPVPGSEAAKGAPSYATPSPSPVPSDTDHAMVRVVDNLFRSLDKLELAVAVHRLFAEDPVSLRTLAHKMLVERDALSHAQRTAEERVLHWLRSSESAPVTGHMFRLTEWLGAAATEDQLIGADPAHPVTVPSLRTPLWRVLVTLMPDRRLQDGWLVVGDIHGLQARTRQLLASAPADTDMVELMAELGIRTHSAKAWLDALPAETAPDPVSAAPGPAQPLPRRTPGANGHHHRGGQPIPAATNKSIDPSAALATLSALSGGRSGMLPGPSLAGAPSTPPPPLPSPSSDPRRWQRIEVTPDHLRGGPVAVPEGYAAQLGMRPGTLLSVTGPGDNAIVLVWQGNTPVFDSLQPVLMRLNARPGDQVYVTVDGYRLEAQLTA